MNICIEYLRNYVENSVFWKAIELEIYDSDHFPILLAVKLTRKAGRFDLSRKIVLIRGVIKCTSFNLSMIGEHQERDHRMRFEGILVDSTSKSIGKWTNQNSCKNYQTNQINFVLLNLPNFLIQSENTNQILIIQPENTNQIFIRPSSSLQDQFYFLLAYRWLSRGWPQRTLRNLRNALNGNVKHQRAKLALLVFLAAIGRHSVELGQVQPYRGALRVQCPVRTVPADKLPRPLQRVEDSTRIDVVRVRPGQPKRRTRWNERTRRRRSRAEPTPIPCELTWGIQCISRMPRYAMETEYNSNGQRVVDGKNKEHTTGCVWLHPRSFPERDRTSAIPTVNATTVNRAGARAIKRGKSGGTLKVLRTKVGRKAKQAQLITLLSDLIDALFDVRASRREMNAVTKFKIQRVQLKILEQNSPAVMGTNNMFRKLNKRLSPSRYIELQFHQFSISSCVYMDI
ncbi:hypothetical protein EAG_08538 [Camponotus floridanus]|uniref:Uncharacterized protein n=1 Tax=Camponotus floridanus TaxID=104421 RepID=E2ANK6_CAMFO|nr:hypothetical protein EAG_08538 [Camponotus floridanus]